VLHDDDEVAAMNQLTGSRRALTRTAFALAAASFVLGGLGTPTAAVAEANDAADTTANHYSGALAAHVAPCATLCTRGTMTGSLEGAFAFDLATMTPAGGSSVLQYTGSVTIRTANGDILGTDSGVWDLATGRVVDHITVTGGTGGWAGASGHVETVGIFDPAAGVGLSEFVANVRTSP
jgi:hypothetical protein